MTLSYRTIKEEIEAGRYTVKRALEIIGVQHARQQITDDEYNELYSMATNLDANNSDDEAAIWRTQVGRRLADLEESVGQLLEGSGTGVKDGFAVYPRTSGVRAGWCCGYLLGWGHAGLAAHTSSIGTTGSAWFGCAGSPGLSG